MKPVTSHVSRALETLSHDPGVTEQQRAALEKNLPKVEAFAEGGSRSTLVDALARSPAFTRAEAEAVVADLALYLRPAGLTVSEAAAGALEKLAKAGTTTTTVRFPIPDMMLKDGKTLALTADVGGDPKKMVSLELRLMVMHPRAKDALQIKLTSPSGTAIELTKDQLAQLGGSEARIKLPSFAGAMFAGKWKLEITDDKKKDGGMIHEAALAIVTEGAEPEKPYVSPPKYEDIIRQSTTRPNKTLEKFSALHDQFMTPEHLQHHAKWHEENGSGGTRGKGSGQLFMLFHHWMMVEMSDFAKAHGANELSPSPIWDPTKAIPPEIHNRKATRDNTDPKIRLPTWLTLDKKAKTVAPGDISAAAGMYDVKSLHDIKTLDDLGRVLGTSGYHGSAHNKIGGTMATFGSPQDPIFFGWHGHLDDLMMGWLKETENGKKWAKANKELLETPMPMGGGIKGPKPVDVHAPIDELDREWRKTHGFPPLVPLDAAPAGH